MYLGVLNTAFHLQLEATHKKYIVNQIPEKLAFSLVGTPLQTASGYWGKEWGDLLTQILGGGVPPKPSNPDYFRATISDNNIGQWLAFPPYPLPNVVLQVQKNIERKVDIIVATLKEGKRGRAFV